MDFNFYFILTSYARKIREYFNYTSLSLIECKFFFFFACLNIFQFVGHLNSIENIFKFKMFELKIFQYLAEQLS